MQGQAHPQSLRPEWGEPRTRHMRPQPASPHRCPVTSRTGTSPNACSSATQSFPGSVLGVRVGGGTVRLSMCGWPGVHTDLSQHSREDMSQRSVSFSASRGAAHSWGHRGSPRAPGSSCTPEGGASPASLRGPRWGSVGVCRRGRPQLPPCHSLFSSFSLPSASQTLQGNHLGGLPPLPSCAPPPPRKPAPGKDDGQKKSCWAALPRTTPTCTDSSHQSRNNPPLKVGIPPSALGAPVSRVQPPSADGGSPE